MTNHREVVGAESERVLDNDEKYSDDLSGESENDKDSRHESFPFSKEALAAFNRRSRPDREMDATRLYLSEIGFSSLLTAELKLDLGARTCTGVFALLADGKALGSLGALSG